MHGHDQTIRRRHAAMVEGDVVILDIDADRYLLGVTNKTASDGPARGPTRVDHRAEGDAIAWAMPTSTIAPSGRREVMLAVNAYNCLLTVTRLLERRTFAELVDRVEAAKVTKSSRAWGAPDLVASFTAIRPFVRQARICRLDAPALCLFLRRHGHDARLVFGVRLRPFAAHCWAQLADAAIIETPEDLRQYTPILAI